MALARARAGERGVNPMCVRVCFDSVSSWRARRRYYRDVVTGSAPVNAFATSIPCPETQKAKKKKERGDTACPVHCARKKKPSDSAEEDEDEGSRSGGGGRGRGRASMLVRLGRAGGDPSVGETEKRS